MKLHYFKTEEFRGQKSKIDPRLLILLDTFRHVWGQPVAISAHPNAIGRDNGDSYHNYVKHGEVYAIDVMPFGIEGYEDALRAAAAARMVGFTGIGFYPHWKPRPGLHLDTRPNRHPDNPALWGGIRVNGRQVYTEMEDALGAMKHEADNHMGI